jgi:RNA-directed DNA polymerase
LRPQQNLRRPCGLLEPDAWKAGTSGSEGAPAQQCVGATRRCHFHARMSGKLWEQKRIIRYYLHRWPSQRSMKRARARIKALTARSQVGQELNVVIGRLNLFLRGWGNYFCTGNAGNKFVELDSYVWWRLQRLLIKKRGRNLRAGQVAKWSRTWFHDQGLHKLMGTIRYPKAA